jgi:preprotein translocase subunit Sec61beta
VLRWRKALGLSSKKDKNKAPMPASSAGLLRFFEDETQGIKIRPEYVVILAAILIIVAVIIPIARS